MFQAVEGFEPESLLSSTANIPSTESTVAFNMILWKPCRRQKHLHWPRLPEYQAHPTGLRFTDV
eukprot:747418-Hanusia_phi.AAC.2